MARYPAPRPQCTIRCKHCGAVKKIDMEQYTVGDELIPYPGGGDYGLCYRCKKKGVIVIEVPVSVPTTATGWAKVPTT